MTNKKIRTLTLEELTKQFPGLKRPTTDQGYVSGLPFYLKPSADSFYFNDSDIVAHDCKKCGIVLSQPLVSEFFTYVVRCKKCKNKIYEVELGSDTDNYTT
ncbi:hypothetical protein HZA97_00545 [Candidatus Woesearchaeota archaeon]|nr:hypothetical protein [Candidatus Woesearchaeota archaeon]